LLSFLTFSKERRGRDRFSREESSEIEGGIVSSLFSLRSLKIIFQIGCKKRGEMEKWRNGEEREVYKSLSCANF